MNTTIDLNGSWRMRAATDTQWQDAVVPGSVYADLLRNGAMPDPYYRDNEDIAFSLIQNDFVYEKTFRLEEAFIRAPEVRLVFEGLDTLADVSLNGTPVLHAKNMHRPYQVSVQPYLRSGENTLTVTFHDPVAAARDSLAHHETFGSQDAFDGHSNLRKAHCMYGWDWGPRLPDAGIYRSVYLKAMDTPEILSVHIQQHHEQDRVVLTLDPEFDLPESVPSIPCTLRTTLLSPEGTLVATAVNENTLTVDQPQLWWPNGYGAQPLYTLRVELVGEEGEAVSTWTRRIGLRTFEITRKKDAEGESFAFTVNGVSIFAMGADYIPEDNIFSRITPERTRVLLTDAASSHFNCIRVWGGGYYPDDFFFDLCDELGLLVWQDFMFACALYDLTPEFEENITEEFRFVIKRLRHHPSLALWCGNNENESGVTGNWWPTASAKLRADYIKMFEYIIPHLLSQFDPQRPYWPSSPSSGGCFDAPSAPNRGDTHYWDVWHADKPFSEYRKFRFRFVSEFGFQSFPALKTVESFTEPEDRNIFSYVMEKHQRNQSANGKIMNYLSATYRYPASFDKLLYASQLLQMEAIRCGVEHWRRIRGVCMGTLFWQLNDIWPVASWASIDYFGRWKALQYAAKRFFAPLLLSCEETGTHTMRTNVNAQLPLLSVPREAHLNLSNEMREDQTVCVTWALRDPSGRVCREGRWEGTVPALSALWLDPLSFPEADLFSHYFSYTLLRDGEEVSSGTSLFCAPKHFRFIDPQLTLSRDGDHLTVSAQAYARMVEIVCEDGDVLLSDNYFDMNAGSRTVSILRGEGHTFRVRSVYDIDKA